LVENHVIQSESQDVGNIVWKRLRYICEGEKGRQILDFCYRNTEKRFWHIGL
jgi:hypothetical protein